MYKVEYLVLFDVNKTKCKTVAALKSLLQADSDISIDKNKVLYSKKTTDLIIKLGKNDDKSHIYFNITLKCKGESDLDWFSLLLKSIKKSLALITKSTYVVWDDLSLYYSNKAYPLLNNIENLMRQVITKFMLTNLGLGWTKERLPTEVQQSVNSGNNDANYLNNVDFIQLKNFLFSDNYPSLKDSLIQKLKSAKDLSNLNIEEIRSLIPNSNWDRYFEPIVECEADYLKKRWDLLYNLRCKVAHNTSFNKTALEEVTKLTSDLKPILEKALASLDNIDVAEEEKDAVFESVLSNYQAEFGKFISTTHKLEMILDFIQSELSLQIEPGNTLMDTISNLFEHGVISHRQKLNLHLVRKTRNNLVHNQFNISLKEVTQIQMILDGLIFELEDLVKYK